MADFGEEMGSAPHGFLRLSYFFQASEVTLRRQIALNALQST